MTNSIEDIAEDAQAYFVIGSNTTEQHPVIGIQIRQAVERRGAVVILADPRRIDLADIATMHLRQRPGTDIALLNGLMNVIIEEELWDKAFCDSRTETWEEFAATIARYTPEYASEITGVPAGDIRRAARLLADLGPGEIVLTHRDGLLVLAGGQFHEAGFYPAALVGRSGRGDTCLAAYVSKRLTAPPEEATIWAAALTSLKMEAEGPFRRDVGEVEALIRRRYHRQ